MARSEAGAGVAVVRTPVGVDDPAGQRVGALEDELDVAVLVGELDEVAVDRRRVVADRDAFHLESTAVVDLGRDPVVHRGARLARAVPGPGQVGAEVAGQVGDLADVVRPVAEVVHAVRAVGVRGGVDLGGEAVDVVDRLAAGLDAVDRVVGADLLGVDEGELGEVVVGLVGVEARGGEHVVDGLLGAVGVVGVGVEIAAVGDGRIGDVPAARGEEHEGDEAHGFLLCCLSAGG